MNPDNSSLVITVIISNLIFCCIGIILYKNPDLLKKFVSGCIDCWSRSEDWREKAKSRIRKRKYKSENKNNNNSHRVYYTDKNNGFSQGLRVCW